MLVLARPIGSDVFIDVPPSDRPTRIAVHVVDIRSKGTVARLGLTAPREVSIRRDDAVKGKEVATPST